MTQALGFWRWAELHPERPALILTQEGEVVRAGELLRLSHGLVHRLRALGLDRPGRVVATQLAHGRELLSLYLATAQAGWYLLPLDPDLPPALSRTLIQLAQPDLLVSQAPGPPPTELPSARCLHLRGEAGWQDAQPLWQSPSATAPDERTAGGRLLLTSGTTGQPRLIRPPLSGLSPEHLGRLAAQHLGTVCGLHAGEGAVHLVSSPLWHSASWLWCTDQLHLGHTVVLPPAHPWDPEAALHTMATWGVTTTLVVPTHLHRWLALPEGRRQSYDLRALRHLVHTGAPCPVTLKERVLDWLGPIVFEVYGTTEGPGTRIGPQEWLQHRGSVGRSHGRVRIALPGGQEAAPGQVGRVFLRSHRPGSDTPWPGFAPVGDLGYLDSEDYLYLVGREDEVVLSGGLNIHPVEVESALYGLPGIADLAVLGLPDPEWGQRLVALFVPEADGSAHPEAVRRLQQRARERLAAGCRPKEYRAVAALPRDNRGKLQRRQLGETLRASQGATATPPGDTARQP